MRHFPASTEFSENQRSIYQAHPKAAMLIVGPPGTGKTVLGIHRAKKICESNIDLKMLMFNETLMLYTKAQTSGDLRFSRNVVKLHTYLIQKFKNLIGGYKHNGSSADFHQMLRLFNQSNDVERKKQLFNDALFIDEGQDFPNEFYKLLADFWVFARTNNINFYPTVMADENQRIKQDENSTIEEIEDIFGTIPGALDLYQKRLLNENYRNTKQIAEVGKKFYPGLKTGVPDIPSKNGDKPVFFWISNKDELSKRIVNYKINNPTKTVGVLIPQTRSSGVAYAYVEALRAMLTEMAISPNKIFVQYYLYKMRNVNLDELNFDASNSITVLTNQSAKGLEFDTVFIPDLEKLETEGEFFTESMTFYVLLHRARDSLFLSANRNKKNAEMTYPPILTTHHLTQDSQKNNHQIGFQNIAELESFIEIEGDNDAIKPKKVFKSEGLYAADSIDLKKKLPDAEKKNIESTVKSGDKKKISPLDLLKLYIANPEKNNQLILAKTSQLDSKQQIEFLGLLKKYKQSQKKPISHPRNKKVIKNSNKSKILKPRSSKANKKVSKTYISFITGKSDATLLRILDIIKGVIKDKGDTTFNVIASTENAASSCAKLYSLLNENRNDFTKTFFKEVKAKNIIEFQDYNGRRNTLNIVNPESVIDFSKSTFIIGLENIRQSELDNQIGGSIGNLLLKIILENRPLTEFIFPDLGDFEIPSVKFIMQKYDDGSIQEKRYGY